MSSERFDISVDSEVWVECTECGAAFNTCCSDVCSRCLT